MWTGNLELEDNMWNIYWEVNNLEVRGGTQEETVFFGYVHNCTIMRLVDWTMVGYREQAGEVQAVDRFTWWEGYIQSLTINSKNAEFWLEVVILQ